MSDKTDQLIEWFLTTFASRTPPRSVLDSTPAYRVGWTEIRAKMQELGLGTSSVVDDNLWWGQLYDARLRSRCNRLLKAAGEKPLSRHRK